MNNKTTKPAWLMAGLLIPGLAVLAQGSGTVEVDQFLLADTDGDECVSWEELRNRGMLVFDALDLNDDGQVDGDEHVRALTVDGREVDPDAVDLTEFQVSLRISFDRADGDENGCLDRKEWDGR